MEACPSDENTTGNTSTPPPSPRGAADFVGSSDGDEVACLGGAVGEIDHTSGKLTARPRPYRRRQKNICHEKLLCVGTRGTLTYYAHLTNQPIAAQTLACIMVGLYEDKIRRRLLADRESFVLVSVKADEAEVEVAAEAKAEVDETEIGDPWVAKLVAPGDARSAAPIRRASVELLGVRHVTFYAKTYTAEYLLTSFLELCETVVDAGELVLIDAAWSDDRPAECLAYTSKNRDAPRPLALRPFASLVAGALGRHVDRPVSWHPSARFIRHFDPKICFE